MRASQARTMALTAAVMLLAVSASWAQEGLTATLQPTGLVQVARGEAAPIVIELSAHGLEWRHAPQATATAEVSDLPDHGGREFVGTLPIPNTDGGAIRYTERVTPLPQGLRLEYSLSMTQAMKLNGLQVSVYLPVDRYGGGEVTISQPHGDPQIAGLPHEQSERGAQIWSGQGARIEVAQGTDDAVKIELQAATDVVIQDLRQWEHPVFEIRFPAIMQDGGRDVAAGDRFHLDLTVSFAAPVRLMEP